MADADEPTSSKPEEGTTAAEKEVEKKSSPPADAPAASDAAEESKEEETPEKGEGGGKGDGKTNGGRRNQRDETPVEELYDLTKPIPRVPRPNKEEHDAELAEITTAIEALKKRRQSVQSKIDSTIDSNRSSAAGAQRSALSELRKKKVSMIEEKKAIRARLDATRDKTEKLLKDRKDTKAQVKFTSIADIDKELAKLQKRQETTSMSLAEEKKLIKEMDMLQASKKTVEDLKTKDVSLEGAKEQRKAITAEIGAKDKEIDAVQKEIDTKQAELKAMQEKESGNRDELKALFAQRDGLKKEMDAKFGERNALRQKFREDNNSWYGYQRAVRAQKKIQFEEEKQRREAEKAEWLKKKEEEEMKKIPYEEEMALCDYLADYLTRTYLTDPDEIRRKQQEEIEKKKQADVVAVKDDPFAGFKPVNKRDDEVFLQMGKGKKKKRDRSAKKSKPPTIFTLNLDSFEQFGLLNLTPPTSLEQVAKSVEDLRAKKKWYSEQKRGSVQTAQEIRKAKERAAQKLRQSQDGGADGAEGGKKKGGKGFSVSSEDFAPLGGGAASSGAAVNSSWGQKMEEKPAEEDVSPAEEEVAKEEDGDAAVDESS